MPKLVSLTLPGELLVDILSERLKEASILKDAIIAEILPHPNKPHWFGIFFEDNKKLYYGKRPERKNAR